jgi:hypothetical protein
MSIIANQFPASATITPISSDGDLLFSKMLNTAERKFLREKRRIQSQIDEIQSQATQAKKVIMHKELKRLEMESEPNGEWSVNAALFEPEDDDCYHSDSNISISGINCLKCGEYISPFKNEEAYLKILAFYEKMDEDAHAKLKAVGSTFVLDVDKSRPAWLKRRHPSHILCKCMN